MKTLTLFICLLCAPLFAALPPGVVGKKIFEYPNQPAPLGSYLFLIDSGNGTYYNITLAQVESLNTNSGTVITTNLSVQYITNLYAYLTNIFSTNIFTTNLSSTYITNTTEYSTNLYVTTNIVQNSYTTNLTANYITNNTQYSTNLFVTNLVVNVVTNNTFITTNVTVNVPGGLTNLNLTPNTLMQADVNDAEASVPNGSGILTNNGAGVFGWVAVSGLGGNYILANNGNGTNTTNWGVSYFQEVDAVNFFPTNLFTGLTNYPVLGTDANGLLILGSATNSFTSTTIISDTNIVNYNYSTNLFFVSGKGNTLIVTNVSIEASLTNKGVAASSIVATDANQVETNAIIGSGLSFSANVLALSVQPTNEVTRQINSGTNIYTSLGTAISDISTATNLSYAYKFLSNVGNGVVTFGQGIFTNISADRTLASLTYGLLGANGYETAIVAVTNSDTAVHTLTMPANVIGKPGKVAPGVFYITNGVISQIMISHMGALYTNACYDF